MQNFERNWKDKFSSFLWFSTLEKYHAYLNHYCEPVPHHISILFCFRQCKRHLDTLSLLILVIMFNESCFLCDLNQVFFNRIRCFSSAKCFYFVVILDAMFSVYSNPHHPIISRQTKKHWIQIILFWNVQYSILNQENNRTMKVCNNWSMSLRLKKRILLLLDFGGRELKPSTVTTRHITASQN